MTRLDSPLDEATSPAGSRSSDRMLRVFAAAAAEGSLSAAARYLGVGQPAVSHAISRLEAALGGLLFDRSPGGVSLTASGQRLYDRIQIPLREIDRAVEETRAEHASIRGDQAVTLSVSTSLASYWLMPRLPEFKRQHPHVELRVLTSDSDRGVGQDDADLWIPLGVIVAPGLDAADLCREQLVPVATPALAATLDSPTAEALRSAPLLHLEERYAPRFDWPRWFELHHVTPPPNRQGYRSNDYSLVLQAALDGQGVALGWVHIVADLIAAGRLVALGEPVETGQPFQILTRTGLKLRAPAEALRGWLQSEMAP